MSAPLAGKFQDHYAILGLDPKADSEEIQAAYARAVEKYGPENFETGDPEKLDAVSLALEVLSDPLLRKEFDKLKGLNQDDGLKFSGEMFFEALGRETRLRVAMLCVLYDRRRTKPFTPSLSMRRVENTLVANEEELNFALWYLKQKGYVGQDDKSSLLITVEGMDYLEDLKPAAQAVMPFIKSDALPGTEEESTLESAETEIQELVQLAEAVEELVPAEAPGSAEAPAPVAKSKESVKNIMRRVRPR